jgi:hypothetical protein
MTGSAVQYACSAEVRAQIVHKASVVYSIYVNVLQ